MLEFIFSTVVGLHLASLPKNVNYPDSTYF